VVVSCGSKVSPGKMVQKISYLDIHVNGRFDSSIDAPDGSIKATRVILGRDKEKRELLVQAFDGANNLVAAYRQK